MVRDARGIASSCSNRLENLVKFRTSLAAVTAELLLVAGAVVAPVAASAATASSISAPTWLTVTVTTTSPSGTRTDVVTPDQVPPSSPGQTSALAAYCGHSYTSTAVYGTFTYQHACGASTSPWGYKIATAYADTITSGVAESGMAWARNLKTQPQQASHLEDAFYQYHGTFNPVHAGDDIEFIDTFSYEIGDESLVLEVSGTIDQLS